MQDLVRTLRFAGIVAGLLFFLVILWVVTLGPAVLILVTPRS